MHILLHFLKILYGEQDNIMNQEQYSVYVYYKENGENEKRLAKWKRVGSTHSSKRALKHAKLLNQRELYDRIEVQQKLTHSHSRKKNGCIIKTYKKDNKWKQLFLRLRKKSPQINPKSPEDH